MSDQKIMDMFVKVSKEVLALKAENRSLKKEIERCKEIAERDGDAYSDLSAKIKNILLVCKGHEEQMWSARIISVILECDFRDAKEELKKHNEKYGV